MSNHNILCEKRPAAIPNLAPFFTPVQPMCNKPEETKPVGAKKKNVLVQLPAASPLKTFTMTSLRAVIGITEHIGIRLRHPETRRKASR